MGASAEYEGRGAQGQVLALRLAEQSHGAALLLEQPLCQDVGEDGESRMLANRIQEREGRVPADLSFDVRIIRRDAFGWFIRSPQIRQPGEGGAERRVPEEAVPGGELVVSIGARLDEPMMPPIGQERFGGRLLNLLDQGSQLGIAPPLVASLRPGIVISGLAPGGSAGVCAEHPPMTLARGSGTVLPSASWARYPQSCVLGMR